MDKSLHLAFTALGRKEHSRWWPGAWTRDGAWLWDRRHRSPFLDLKRINKSNRFHHNVPSVLGLLCLPRIDPPIVGPLRRTSTSTSGVTTTLGKSRYVSYALGYETADRTKATPAHGGHAEVAMAMLCTGTFVTQLYKTAV